MSISMHLLFIPDPSIATAEGAAAATAAAGAAALRRTAFCR